MKKLMILAVSACAAMLTATAEENFLYWMVDVNDKTDYSFSYATIKAVNSNGTTSDYLSFYGSDASTSIGTKSASTAYLSYIDNNGTGANTGTQTSGGAFTGIDGYVGSTFLVELWADSSTDGSASTRVAWGNLAYSLLKDSVSTGLNQSGATAYTVTGSQLIPEPTSGLLALLGFAALALRRKQKKA